MPDFDDTQWATGKAPIGIGSNWLSITPPAWIVDQMWGAGIALVGGKYPLYQAAQDSHAALEQAKHTPRYEDGKKYKKDAICFLGQVLPWQRFGLEDCSDNSPKTAHALLHQLYDDANQSTTPLIRRLIGFHEKYQEALEDRKRKGVDQNRAGQAQILWGPWNWLSYYSLSRLFRQQKDESIRDLRDQLKADDFRSIEWIGLAARWAELRLRK